MDCMCECIPFHFTIFVKTSKPKEKVIGVIGVSINFYDPIVEGEYANEIMKKKHSLPAK